jgi:hypothetical protein
MHLRTKALSLLILMACALTLPACSGVKPSLVAERPRDEAFRTELKRELSTLNVAIEASSDDLARTLNQVVGREIYKGATGTKGLAADVVRSGPIAVSAADNYLYLTVPVTVSLSYGIFQGPTVSSRLKFRVNARVTPDWRITTEIAYLGLADQMADEIGIGPISIRPRAIVEGITQPVQKLLSDAVNRKINEAFPLKAQAARAWRAAHKPVLLDRNYNAWLKITPRDVMLSPLSARNNQVRVSIGISAFAELVVGPEPPAAPLAPLPNLKLVNGFDKGFRIALNADLYYKDILAIASPLLLNKRFDADGKSIVLKDFDVYGSGDRLVVRVATEGSLDGVFYLTCKPCFDPQTHVFSVKEIDFDMNTKSLLLQSANWFLHGTIRDAIQEKLNMDLTRRLEESREMARKAMARVNLVENVILKGDVTSLRFGDAIVQKDRISIQVYTEGEAAVGLQ